MTEEKGILTAAQEEEAGKVLDSLVDFSKIKYIGFLEAFDDKAFMYLLRFVDNNWGDKLPEEYKTALSALFDALIKGDWKAALDPVSEVIDHLSDIPLVPDDAEATLIHAIVLTMFDILEAKLQKKAA